MERSMLLDSAGRGPERTLWQQRVKPSRACAAQSILRKTHAASTYDPFTGGAQQHADRDKARLSSERRPPRPNGIPPQTFDREVRKTVKHTNTNQKGDAAGPAIDAGPHSRYPSPGQSACAERRRRLTRKKQGTGRRHAFRIKTPSPTQAGRIPAIPVAAGLSVVSDAILPCRRFHARPWRDIRRPRDACSSGTRRAEVYCQQRTWPWRK